MKDEYSGWSGVRTLAKKLGYSWFDVCDILWKTKHHKKPKFKEILIFSVIRKNLIRIKLGKHLRDVHGNLVKRKEGEHDIHYAIRADLDLFKHNHIIKKQGKMTLIFTNLSDKNMKIYTNAFLKKLINKRV